MMEEMLEFMNNQSLRKRCEPLNTTQEEYIEDWETDYEVMTHETKLEYFLAAGKNEKALVHLRKIVELTTPSDPTEKQDWIDRDDNDPSNRDASFVKKTARMFACHNARIATMKGEEEKALAYMRVHFGITSRMIGQYSKKFADKG